MTYAAAGQMGGIWQRILYQLTWHVFPLVFGIDEPGTIREVPSRVGGWTLIPVRWCLFSVRNSQTGTESGCASDELAIFHKSFLNFCDFVQDLWWNMAYESVYITLGNVAVLFSTISLRLGSEWLYSWIQQLENETVMPHGFYMKRISVMHRQLQQMSAQGQEKKSSKMRLDVSISRKNS